MERCPACNASYNGKEICHRCKTDLRLILDVEHRAAIHRQQAISSFINKNIDQMFFHAQRSYSLHKNLESVRLLGCAALLVKRFDIAVSIWNQMKYKRNDERNDE